MSVCMFVCMIMRFPSPCPGPGYCLLSRRVVPPPQSNHWKQLLSGESTHPTRHEKERHINYKGKFIHTYIYTYLLTYKLTLNYHKLDESPNRLGRPPYIKQVSRSRTSFLVSIAAPLTRRNCRTGTWPS